MCGYITTNQRGGTMAMSVKDFLLLYFRQRHFNEMPPEIRARFDDYAKKDDFRGDMKSWKKDLMHTNANGKLVQNDLPDAATAFVDAAGNVDNSLWESLFLSIQNALVEMSANRDSFKDNSDATKFLDEYFGDPRTKIFSLPPLNQQTVTSIDNFVTSVLKDPSINSFAMFSGLFNDDYNEYKDFIESLTKGKYKSDPNVRNKLVRIISSLASRLEYGDISNQALVQTLENLDLNGIISGLNQEAVVDPTKLNEFKQEYQKILNTLHDKTKVYSVFKNYDKGKISKQLDEAIAKTDYTGKITEKDYVAPKRDDQKTLWQRIEDNVKDTYSDTLKKYVTAHRDHIYVKPTTKSIIAALDGEKIKPVDGIGAVLDKQSNIAKRLKDKTPTGDAHFKWFVDMMQELKSTMPKAFEGALRNGRQMHRLIEEMVLKAINDNKIDEAKTAMEVLSVMRYGLFTSRRMDALNKTDLTLFSDGGLSWNKDANIKSITKAVDKTIKFGIQTTGYAVTGVVNGLRRTGTSFNHSGKLQQKSDEWEQQNQQDKNDFLNNYVTPQNNADTQEIQRQTGIQNTAQANLGLNQNVTLTQRKTDLTNGRLRENRLSENIHNLEQAIAPLVQTEEDHRVYLQEQTNKQNKEAEILGLEAQLRGLGGTPNNQLEAQQADILKQQLTKAQKDLNAINKKIQDIDTRYQATGGIIATFNPNVQQRLANARAAIQNINNRLTAEKNQNDILSQNINDYENAQSVINTCQDSITKRNQRYQDWDSDHKNKYNELMGFWDFLQTGHTKNIFRFSTKKLQKKMDNGKMVQIYNDWMTDHSYAA